MARTWHCYMNRHKRTHKESVPQGCNGPGVESLSKVNFEGRLGYGRT